MSQVACNSSLQHMQVWLQMVSRVCCAFWLSGSSSPEPKTKSFGLTMLTDLAGT